MDVLIKALRDAYSGEKLLMTEDELRATMNAYCLELMTEDVNPSRIGSVCAHGVVPS